MWRSSIKRSRQKGKDSPFDPREVAFSCRPYPASGMLDESCHLSRPLIHMTTIDNARVTAPPVQLDLSLDSPLMGKAKNERTLMVYSWFALTREKQTELAQEI